MGRRRPRRKGDADENHGRGGARPDRPGGQQGRAKPGGGQAVVRHQGLGRPLQVHLVHRGRQSPRVCHGERFRKAEEDVVVEVQRREHRLGLALAVDLELDAERPAERMLGGHRAGAVLHGHGLPELLGLAVRRHLPAGQHLGLVAWMAHHDDHLVLRGGVRRGPQRHRHALRGRRREGREAQLTGVGVLRSDEPGVDEALVLVAPEDERRATTGDVADEGDVPRVGGGIGERRQHLGRDSRVRRGPPGQLRDVGEPLLVVGQRSTGGQLAQRGDVVRRRPPRRRRRLSPRSRSRAGRR